MKPDELKASVERFRREERERREREEREDPTLHKWVPVQETVTVARFIDLLKTHPPESLIEVVRGPLLLTRPDGAEYWIFPYRERLKRRGDMP